MTISPKIDIDRLASEIETLAGFSDAPPPAVTRVLFTSQDLAARDYLKGLFTAVGLDVRVDAVGNIFARWHGGDPSAAAVGTGSHTDAIPHSGRYDGTVGVLGGLEAIRSLQAAGFQPKRSIELLMFTSEEPTRFGMGCIGSRLLSGAIDAAKEPSVTLGLITISMRLLSNCILNRVRCWNRKSCRSESSRRSRLRRPCESSSTAEEDTQAEC